MRVSVCRTYRELRGEQHLELHALGLGDAALLGKGPPAQAELVLQLPHPWLQDGQLGVALLCCRCCVLCVAKAVSVVVVLWIGKGTASVSGSIA